MTVTSVKMDSCADHINKKPGLIIKNTKSSNTVPKNLTWDSSGDGTTQ